MFRRLPIILVMVPLLMGSLLLVALALPSAREEI
jgi:hypothetical protein